jgi:transposase
MRRRAYSGRNVKQVNVEELMEGRQGQPVWVGTDIGKYEMSLVVHWGPKEFERPWRVQNPFEIPQATAVLKRLASGRPLVVSMEPSGTYGDAFRQALWDAGLPVHRVHPKVSHDYAEVFDGVPSQHDGKDAAVVAELSRTGKSVPWTMEPVDERQQQIDYWVGHMDIHRRLLQICTGRLEGQLARYWPEVVQFLQSSGPTLLQVLINHGTPAALAGDAQARHKLRSWSRGLLKEHKIDRLCESARSTVGVRMNRWDIRRLRELAQSAVAARREVNRSRRQLSKLTVEHSTIQRMASAVGLSTACVLWVYLGDPHHYSCAEAYVKAMGLNLAERSSGLYKGRLKISKRGHGMVRYWMYLASMRMLNEGPVRRWFESKKQRDGNKGGKAMVGVMRRLGKALYHVGANGKSFKPQRLFPGLLRHQKGR